MQLDYLLSQASGENGNAASQTLQREEVAES